MTSKTKLAPITPHQLSIAQEQRLDLFRQIPVNEQGFVLHKLNTHVQQDILNQISNEEIIQLLHYLDIDEETDLFYGKTSS